MAYDLVAKLKLIDNMSAPLRRATSSMERAGKVAQNAGGNFTKMGSNGTKSFMSLGNSAGSLVKKITGIGTAVVGIGAAIGTVAVAKSSLDKALDFEAQLSSIKALTGASNEEMAKMENLALNMGAATKYNALQAAQGIEELLKAGLTPATVASGGLEAALNLATAGGLELASAAEIMSTALNAFKKDGMSAAEASNVLAGTANASATGVEDLRLSLAAASAVAAGIGMSFKDTNTALGLFANNGLKGSDAGTSLKTMLQNLQPTTKAQIALSKKLGLITDSGANSFFDATGNVQSLDKIAGTLHKSLGKLTNQQRSLALETLFGTDAIRAANILYDEGADGVKKFYDEMGHVTALQVATEKMNNGRGAIEQFKGALETLQIRALKPLLPAVKAAFNGMGDFITNKTPQITAAIERMASAAKTHLRTHFLENPEFQKLTTISGKVQFVIQDLLATFNTWLAGGGQGQIDSAVSSFVTNIADVIGRASPTILSACWSIGKSMGSTLVSSISESVKTSPYAAFITGAVAGGAVGSVIPGVGTVVGGVVGGLGALQANKSYNLYKQNKKSDLPQFNPGNPYNFNAMQSPEKKAGGMSRIPYNGFPMIAHKDEMLLTKSEADTRRDGRGNSAASVLVTGNTFVVRQDSDINAIADALATRLNAIGTVMAG